VGLVVTELEKERESLLDLYLAAFYALRSYQYGNAAPDLAEEIADKIKSVLKDAGKLG
jgi:hypothetical protein